MNGGAIGAYHINAPWGDPLQASLYGSNAVLWGSEELGAVVASMTQEPETAPMSAAPSADVSACIGECRKRFPLTCWLPGLAACSCVQGCRAGKGPATGLFGTGIDTRAIILMALGAAIIVVGTSAFVK